MERILIIDHDAGVVNTLGEYLDEAGFAPAVARDGLSGLREFHDLRPNLVILNVELPQMDGLTVASRIREVSRVPVIVLTAVKAEETALLAYALAVDDYVTKPFSCAVMVERVKAILRRVRGSGDGSNDAAHSAVVTTGDLTIDLAERWVMRKGERVHLTPTEYGVLATLVRNRGRTVTHECLVDAVWGPVYAGETEHIKRYVWSLRKKLEDDPGAPVHILSERGFGYRFE